MALESLRLKTYLALAAFALLPLLAPAQSRSETSLYKKTLKNLSVKSADKFLKKYPKSVYAVRVQELKDSILLEAYIRDNTSLITREEALSLSGSAVDAIGWKKDGADHILALDADLTLRVLSPEGTLQEVRSIPPYSMESAPAAPVLRTPMELVSPLGGKRKYVHFSYTTGASEYVEALYLPEEDVVYQALFYGNPLPLEGGEPYRIEGRSPEMMEGLSLAAEQAYLVGLLRDNPALVPIARADELTDAAIRWWLERNPKAETTAGKLVFGRLDTESSLVTAFKDARPVSGTRHRVGKVQLRGYEALVALNRKTGEYSLVWCEPVCRDKKTEKYISNFYFESDGTTLDVCYYKGRTTFKNKIDLLSGSLRHLK